MEFLSCCKCSGGNKYGYSLRPLNGSWIAQPINCLRLKPRKFNVSLLLLQTPCHSSQEYLICNNKSGRSSSKRNWIGFKGLEERRFPQVRAPLPPPANAFNWNEAKSQYNVIIRLGDLLEGTWGSKIKQQSITEWDPTERVGWISRLLLPGVLVQPNSSSPVAWGLQGNQTLWNCFVCPVPTAYDMLLTGEMESRHPKRKIWESCRKTKSRL